MHYELTTQFRLEMTTFKNSYSFIKLWSFVDVDPAKFLSKMCHVITPYKIAIMGYHSGEV